jgi:hypothetical protein
MKRFLLAALVSVALCGASGGQLFAQIGTYTPPYNVGPPVSPYLNMFRGNPAINYYGIVQPQMQMSQQMFQLQNAFLHQPINMNLTPAQQALGAGLPVQNELVTTTGHPVMFQNLSYYYPMYGGGQGFGGFGGAFGTSGTYFPGVINNAAFFRR